MTTKTTTTKSTAKAAEAAKLTANERTVLNEVLHNEITNGQVGTPIWANDLASYLDMPAKSVPGVVASLQKKGLVVCEHSGKDATIAPTAAGLAAFGYNEEGQKIEANAPTTEAPAKASSKAKKADETAAKANDTSKAPKATSEAPTAPANEAPVSKVRTFEVLQAGGKFEVCEVGTEKVIATYKSQAKAEAECERQNRAYLPPSPPVAPEHKAAAADAIAAKLAEVNADTAAKAAAPKVDAPKRQRAAATGDWKGKAMSVLPAEGDTLDQLIAKRAEAVAKRDRIAAQAGTRSELHIKRGTALYNFRISQLDEAIAAADKPLTPAEASKVVEFAASEPTKRRNSRKAATK